MTRGEMMRLLWLPEVLRAAGLTVHEVSGWRTRGDASYGPVRGITCHHTAGARTSTDAGEIGVLLHGSETAPPPIAQLYLSRTGHWHVVASGLCYHSLIGWAGPNSGVGNDALLGIEAQHSGGSEPWTEAQYRSYVRGVAALVRHKAAGWDVPLGHVAGHKEHQPGAKTDPSFDMDRFRADVRAVLTGEDDVSFSERLAETKSTKSRFGAGNKTAEEYLKLAAIYAYDGAKGAGAAVAAVTALRAVVEQLGAAIRQGGGSVDTAAILAGVDSRLTALRAELPEATADAVVAEIAS